MRLRLPRLIPPAWRWGGAVTLVLLAVLLGWYFFLRPSSPTNPAIAQPPLPRPALGKTISFTDYRSAIAVALTEVKAAEAASKGSSERKNHIAGAVKRLDNVEGAGVTAPGMAQAVVDNTDTIAALHADDPALSAVESKLTLLLAALDAPDGRYVAGTANGSTANAQLQQVLSDPIFNYDEQLSPLQRLQRWLAGLTGQADPGDTFGRLLLSIMAGIATGSLVFLASDRLHSRWQRLGLSALAGAIVAAIFYAGLGALNITFQLLGLVGLVVAAVAVGIFAAGVRRGAAPASPRRISDLASVLGMNAVEARRRAGEAASEGDFRAAVRYRCLAVLLTLDEAGKLAFDRSATNREYLFRASGPLHDELQPLLDRFDDVWYGGVPTDEADWQDYNSRAARVEGMVAGSAEKRAA